MPDHADAVDVYGVYALGGMLRDLDFTSFENLTGSGQSDWFDLANGVGVRGQIDGGAGRDTLDYRDYTRANADRGQPGHRHRATSIDLGLAGVPGDSSIENVFGGSGDDLITGDSDRNVLGDGLGSDTLSGGGENDRYVLTPGGSERRRISNETGGSPEDTLDFSLASAGVTIDLDLLDVPPRTCSAATPCGSTASRRCRPRAGSRTSSAASIPTRSISTRLAEIRWVEGNDPTAPALPGDQVNFEAAGSEVLDNGTSLTAGGIGTVLYSEIESIRLWNAAPRIVDNADLGWAVSGGWTWLANQGYANDIHTRAVGGNASEVASWTFNGVTPGEYLVSATWTWGSNRATNATYTVKDGSTQTGPSAVVNQQNAPSDFRAGGVLWDAVGHVHRDGPHAAGRVARRRQRHPCGRRGADRTHHRARPRRRPRDSGRRRHAAQREPARDH